MSLEIKKSKDRFACSAFLNYVRSQPCCVCSKPATASHMKSIKYADGSDALAVPACMPDHHVQSTRSSMLILFKNGINIEELHVKLWNGFLYEHVKIWNGFFYKQGIIRLVETQKDFERVCEAFGLREKAPTKRKNR